MSIADDLEKVLFGVADKWCQGTVDDRKGNHCLVGWAGIVECNNPRHATKLASHLNDFLFDYSNIAFAVVTFNDSHTQQEVIWMLEEAIDDAKERGL